MNRLIFRSVFIILLIGTACTKNQEFKLEKALVSSISFRSPAGAKSVKVDPENSRIRWKGTKMLGTAGHEGMVDILESFLLLKGDSLVGGKITVDMNTIRIIGKSDYKEEDMQGLSNYLKKRALTADKYPFATFEITHVNYLGGDDLRVWGNMSIKDVTKNISFPAVIKRSGKKQQFYAALTMDRFGWNVGVDGNLLEVNLVDKEFYLEIELTVL